MVRPPTTISSAGGRASQGTEYAMPPARLPGGSYAALIASATSDGNRLIVVPESTSIDGRSVAVPACVSLLPEEKEVFAPLGPSHRISSTAMS